ncbi:MAG: hypothetical protein HY707_08250, partial [Ignavibacteriae bacterium]|nr:hypothetical protein [Ignavibacteriota bacterium]
MFSITFAQISNRISKVDIDPYRPGDPLSMRVDLIDASNVERVEIAYRSFGRRDFTRNEMQLTASTATVSLPAPTLAPPFLEYYFLIYDHGVSTPETFPQEHPEENPFRFTLQEDTLHSEEIIILSPEQNEHIRNEDVLIAFTVVSTDTLIDKGATKIFLNDGDISRGMVVSDNLFVVKPDNLSISLSNGSHTIRVDLVDKQGKLYRSHMWQFSVSGAVEPIAKRETASRLYATSIQLETRHEDIANQSTPYNRAGITASGNYDQFRLKGRLFVTNEEKSIRQPQNRYFIGVESPWINVGYGDSYPEFPDLIMNGKRVRGLTGNLMLSSFHLDVTKGDILRRIESDTIKTFPRDSLFVEQSRDSTAAYGIYDETSVPERWAKFRYGTFDRNVTVVRPSFGKEGSRLSFTYLKSSDEVSSIRYGIKPQENILFGIDLLLSFDRRNFEITGQAAISATNKDISKATFSDSDIDSIFKDPTYSESDREDIRTVRDILSRFITVNQHLIPLSFKNLSTLAYEGGLTLNYFNNHFKFMYLRRGNSFESFGNPYLRTDVVGFNVFDRLRLVKNRLSLSAGYERLRDNTAENKPATTTSQTVNVSVSYVSPTEFPNVTLGYILAANENKIHNDSLFAIDDRTYRLLVQMSREFTAHARHNASISFSTSTRNDQTLKNLNTRSTMITLSNVSQFKIPLQTTFSITIYLSKFSASGPSGVANSTRFNYTSIYTQAQYRLMEEKLRLSGSVSPTFGDIKRTLIDTGVQYFFLQNLSTLARLSLYFNENTPNSTLW